MNLSLHHHTILVNATRHWAPVDPVGLGVGTVVEHPPVGSLFEAAFVAWVPLTERGLRTDCQLEGCAQMKLGFVASDRPDNKMTNC